MALLRNETLPDNVLVLDGEKVTVALWLADGANVNGNTNPVRLNAAPVRLAEETVTFELPVFVNVTELWADDPTGTDPKEREVGEALSK